MSRLPFHNQKKIDDPFLRDWLNLHAGALNPVANQLEGLDQHLMKYLEILGDVHGPDSTLRKNIP